MAFDAGIKRVGIAVSDPLKITATALAAVESEKVIDFVKQYVKHESVETFVVGYPLDLYLRETHGTTVAEAFIKNLKKHFPDIPIQKIDERFTSQIAQRTLIDAGYKKKQRQNKSNIDKISAVIILQSYLEQNA
jgi:putative Holliday junction resolvase